MVVRISDKTQNYSKVTKLQVKPLVNKSGVPYTAGLDILSEPHEFNGRKYPAFKTQLLNKK